VSATGAENADGGYRGVADASEFRAATTGFLAARQKQLATVPQLTADGVRQVRSVQRRASGACPATAIDEMSTVVRYLSGHGSHHGMLTTVFALTRCRVWPRFR
jgi:hypothetical protein